MSGAESSARAELLRSIVDACDSIYRQGWAENHAGNLSYRLTAEEAALFPDDAEPRRFDLPGSFPEFASQAFLVTAAGGSFRVVGDAPERSIGLIVISDDGENYTIRWGLEGGHVPTSELPAHLLGHRERLKVDPDNRVVLHCHPTHTVAMTHVHDLDEGSMTRTLWSTNSECILAFPAGVAVLPWMVCGTEEIGRQSADKFLQSSIVIWPCHGVLAAGASIQNALGVIESVEKAALTYMLVRSTDARSIIDSQLADLAEAFGITVRAGILREDAR